MLFSKRFISLLELLLLVVQVASIAIGGKPSLSIKSHKRGQPQDIVTWDEYSIFVRGKRILFYSGEFHPFRLPVPSLWLDIFQKIKALGYSGVSFYTNWALLEGAPGNFSCEGIFALEPFFEAASQAGLYLLARPGPYINAEVSGGGFPGWLQRTEAVLRTTDYLNYTANYVANIGAIIAKAQITNGGPVILVQPENEYSIGLPNVPFPDASYFTAVEKQLLSAGIVVPFINNDASPGGLLSPGSGLGGVDIYGHDSFPLGFDCGQPTIWPEGLLPTNFRTLHLKQSPTTPYSLVEFQGGFFDPWGGGGFANCEQMLNEQFERVFYKNDFSFGVTIFNVYMTYGGTNWGNLGFPGGYTSYDYGAVIAEDRTVTREKYSEAKLEANFLKASPAYLTAIPMNATNASFANTNAITVTQLKGNNSAFYIVRHINVTNLLYSSAEVFTWKSYESKTILVLYGDLDETHEAAIGIVSGAAPLTAIKTGLGEGVDAQIFNGSLILNWIVSPTTIVVVPIGDNLILYLMNRNEAYNCWVLDLPNDGPVYNFTDPFNTAVIIRAGYLLRTAAIDGQTLSLTGDINETTTIEVMGAPSGVTELSFNGETVSTTRTSYGALTGNVTYTDPRFSLPILSDLDWRAINSLPEIDPEYDDSAWTNASATTTGNPENITTPTSLYGSDYGYNCGNLLFHGHFKTIGVEHFLSLSIAGGTAFGYSVWLNNTFLGSWAGHFGSESYDQTLTIPSNLPTGSPAVITLLMDQMGFNENQQVGSDEMKFPHGIFSYNLWAHAATDLTWKITGNLGGEAYLDKARGPLNEGGLYAERFGYHLPYPPSHLWQNKGKPMDGFSGAGVWFYTANFTLDMPAGYDIPLSFQFTNGTASSTGSNYRTQLYVNGYQFGKYINNIGPQTSFPVPEGILNYHGYNYLALSLWALDAAGARIEGLQLVDTARIQTGYGTVELSPNPPWVPREGAY
ncbi:hypothetical protein P7C71_g5850, partial [Lecanoromycetidae sp. Uapishka_2]